MVSGPARRLAVTAAACAASAMGGKLDELGGMDVLASRADHSWLRDLLPDPETDTHAPNKKSRQVKSGHYVKVKPTALRRPQLVAVSPRMPRELGLTEEACQSEAFVRFFSGDVDVAGGKLESWATPYALSIFGQEMYDNCPFKNGNGYGDGRAQSVGEVVVYGRRWELQLKGGGQTPFCRGADGRAVLRSSVREFLASEAMNAMGVETTRALSLIVSQEDTVGRPWFEKDSQGTELLREINSIMKSDDPAHHKLEAFLGRVLRGGEAHAKTMVSDPGFTPEDGRALLKQIASQVKQPDKMQVEKCAITCRVAPSFTRIGHVELHGRRARKSSRSEQDLRHLELIVKHALQREYSDVDDPAAPLQSRVLVLAEAVAQRLSKLMADWLRVGYCQGNFNSDNCLLAGRTMDYGPFGFMEEYDPMWNMWTGGGEHFAFINQPKAANRNFFSLTTALAPLLDAQGKTALQKITDGFPATCSQAVNDMWRRKLGLTAWEAGGQDLFTSVEKLLAESHMDYTIFWRQLAQYPARGLAAGASDEALLELLLPAQYGELSAGRRERWLAWLRSWLVQLAGQGDTADEQAALMRATSPKYVPREWMLVEAYEAAERGDYSVVHRLQRLFDHPFDEQPDEETHYYRRAPQGSQERGGTAFMT